MIQVYIDDYLIPDSDIIKIETVSQERLSFSFSNIISAKMSIDLNNIDRTKYDEEIQGSLLFNNWFDRNIRLYDTQYKITTWNGRIKNLKRDDKKKTLAIETSNFIKEIVDTNCIHSSGVLSDKTPSEIIYELLSLVVGIPEYAINKESFDIAHAIQAANSGYILIQYDTASNIKCSSVISEILKITSSFLYTKNNIIYYKPFVLYNGEANLEITESEIVSNALSTGYNTDNIFNDYYIAYLDSESNVNFLIPQTLPEHIGLSRQMYGTKQFIVPDKDQKSTSLNDYRILFKSIDSAQYFGDLIIERSFNKKKEIQFNISKKLIDKVYLNTHIDVSYMNWIREPLRVVERKIQKNTIEIKAEMLNYPYEYVQRHTIPPEAVEIVNVFSVEDTLVLKFTQTNISADLIDEYMIYFSENIYEWDKHFCNQGISPLTLRNYDIVDGYILATFTGFNINKDYYFKVKVKDLYRNVSKDSNIVKYNHYINSFENAYRTEGHILKGIYITPDNPFSGTAPDFSKYDSMDYDEGNHSPVYGEYITQVFKSETGFKNFTFFTKYLSRNDSIKIFKRTQNEDNSFNEWGEYYLINGEEVLDTEGAKRIQFRFWFNVPLLGSNDLIYITNYEEI